MTLRAIRQRFDKKNNPPKTNTSWQWIGILPLGFAAVVLGAGAAIFPASFVVKLGFLIAATLVLIAALLVPADARTPKATLRFLLFAVTVLCVIWPIYLSYHGLPGPNVNPTRLAYWSLTGLWLFWFISSRDLREQISHRVATFRPFTVMLFTYLGWALISAIASDHSVMSTYYLIKLMLGPVLIFFVALSCLRDKRDVDFLLLLMVIAALFACGIGMLEAKKKANLFYNLVPSMFPQADTDGGIWTEKLAGDKSRAGAYRVMATFSHPLTFGEYLAISFPLSLYIAGYARYWWQRALGVMMVPAILAGIYVTHTRSNVLAVGVALIAIGTLLGLRTLRQRRSFAASMVGAFSLVTIAFSIVALIAIGIGLAAGHNAQEMGSTLARAAMLKYGISLALDSPLFGYGPGFAAATLGFLPGFTVLTIDSYYLSVVLESGFPGLMLFFGLLAYPIIKGFRAGLRLTGKDGVRVAVIVSALVSFSVVRSVLSLTENFDVVFLIIALLAISLKPDKDAVSADLQTPVRGRHRS